MPSAEGNERMALERVSAIVAPLGLAERRLKRLETAVGEATMNAMEHGNHYRADLPVTVRVLTDADRVRVEIVDLGRRPRHREAEVPDLEAKLAGLQRPRGWGLFLIKNMVDEARETSDGEHHVLELVMRPERRRRRRGQRVTTHAHARDGRQDRDDVAVIDLAGDINAAPSRRWRPRGTTRWPHSPTAVVLNFEAPATSTRPASR